eukprot:TRINITY_DN95317_c0_g1_i1.p2 TRINITY_DN95317_c0_g1~~TRINITY_DN95317_c0_g1_i1.p2  ORF type:complete len:282 (-),score=67.00 TRINITY_DN95317_c0_g1_i1:178-1023(-)
MSLAQSFGRTGIPKTGLTELTDLGWSSVRSRKASERPRVLCSDAAGNWDEETLESPTVKREASFSRTHGNAKPQEPCYLSRKRFGFDQRMRNDKHPKPWSSSSQPGKRENPHAGGCFRRTWLQDMGLSGRWTRSRKHKFYREQDEKLFSLQPHDEKHANDTNAKFFTHLKDAGAKKGGQDKLCYTPERLTGKHLKSGLYRAKFNEIKKEQMRMPGKKDLDATSEQVVWVKDERKRFDNRLRDDNIRMNDTESRTAAQASFDTHRPTSTMSCPQLGADFMNR